MRVQRVVMPGSGLESWTVLGEDHVPFEPVERFLGYLASIERSPNTVKAYAHDLKDWFGFLAVQRLGRSRWRTSRVSWRGFGCHRPPGTGR
jgi:integrase/recombinase XerD